MEMKGRRKKSRRTGAQILVVHTKRGQRLDYPRAQWLADSPSPVLLPFSYESKKSKDILRYDITGLPTIVEYLGMRISRNQYVSLLSSIGELGQLCASTNLPMDMVQFEEKDVYVRGTDLVFCCLPVEKTEPEGAQVLQLLRFLSDGSNVHFVNPDDSAMTEVTLDFVRRHRIFSSFEYDQWLAKSFETDSGDTVEEASAKPGEPDDEKGAAFDPFVALPSDEIVNPLQAGRLGIVTPNNGWGGSSPARPLQTPALRGPATTSTHVAGMDNTYLLGDTGAAGGMQRVPTFSIVRNRDGSRLCAAVGSVVIGRSPHCGARVRGAKDISRQHAMVTDLGSDRFEIRDLGSTNGTKVRGIILRNGQKTEISLREDFSLSDEFFHIER
ncbi:FHA domain-containing protein [Bifidobacterium sp. ESL0775]|uniref:FHA domain-containing protein n=1 Tax=Bifidobacterium sp. ESL0775 TaxID=2983230 RepID=UPI0023F825C4|nr:FHA domain-containing protein [Bifidobacterium sp. ESL0775]WEV69763.1 FHA domain-containing protein [Bifidobacterium sp. ESL0775]